MLMFVYNENKAKVNSDKKVTKNKRGQLQAKDFKPNQETKVMLGTWSQIIA